MKLSVIMPVYNEAKTIRTIFDRVRSVDMGIEKEIILIDDGSTDGTADIINNLSPQPDKVIFKDTNTGRGAAIKTGLKYATGDFVIWQDADLEYLPTDYTPLLAPFQKGADMSIGSRTLKKPMRLFGNGRVSMTTYFGRIITAALINILYWRRGTDYFGCYKVFRRALFGDVEIHANGFDFDTELLCKLFKKGVKTEEVPISYEHRKYDEGKKISWRDGFRIIYSIIRCRFGGY